MTFVLDAALRSSVPLAVALVACVLLRRRSAALRHSVLTAGFAAAVAVLPLSVVVPSWTIALPVQVAPAPWPGTAAPESAQPGAGVDVPAMSAQGAVLEQARTVSPAATPTPVTGNVFLLVWLCGVALGSGLLMLGIVRLVRLTRAARPVVDGLWHRVALDLADRSRIRRPVTLLATPACDVLATWGVFRPRVLLPSQARTWNEDRARVALSHELAHIRRWDWPIQVGADLFRTVFWFNPLIWLLCAGLRRESEHACDDAVLGAGVPAGAYASELVAIARACRPHASPWVPAVPMARPSTLEGRITAMLDTRLNRQAPSWGAMGLIAAALAAIALPIASFELSAQGVGAGALTGYVYDNSGAVLPGVEVALLDARNRDRRSAVSDGSGRFQFQKVGAGKYVLEATLPGFRTVRNELALAVPRDWTRNITMQVGELEETIFVKGKRPAQAVPLRSGANAGKPVRVGGNIKVPHKVKDVPPVYPEAMQAAGIEGLVRMDAIIGTDGRVVSARVLSTEVHPELARAAEEAVRQWVFTPTLLNNIAVEVEMTVSVDFSLED